MTTGTRMAATLALLVLAGCPPTLKAQLSALEREGRFVEATDRALEELAHDLDALRTRRLVDHYAPLAHGQLVDKAREHEAQGRYEASIETFREVLALEERLRAASALTFPAEDVRHELTAVEEALALRRYETGLQHESEGRLMEAIAAWQGAREVRESYRDTTDRMARAYERQAHDDLESRRWAYAKARFKASHELDGGEEALAWYAAMRAAYGREYLRRGACRTAVEHLEVAFEIGIDVDVRNYLDRAMRCARVEVIFHPFDDLTGDQLQGTAIGAVLSDRVAALVRDRRSRHLVLVDPEAAGPTPTAEEGRRYQVRGRITRYQVDRPDPATSTRRGEGVLMVTCAADHSDAWDEEAGFLCREPVNLTWSEHERGLGAHIGASLRVIGDRGEQVATLPLDADSSRTVRWADNFQRVTAAGSSPIKVGPEAGLEVAEVDEALLALTEPPQPLPAEGTLIAEALDALVDRSATAVLEAVDGPDDVAEPQAMVVRPPVMDISHIEFGQANPEVEVERPPEPEPPEVEPEPEPEPEEAPEASTDEG